RWRNHGQEVIAPTYVRTFFAVLEGATTVRQVAKVTGLAETTAAGHLKRLKGWGLVDWGVTRAGNIRPNVYLVPLCDRNHGSDTIDIVLASEAGVDFPTTEDEHPPTSEPVVTDVRELRKGDVLTLEGHDYPVKEVRI